MKNLSKYPFKIRPLIPKITGGTPLLAAKESIGVKIKMPVNSSA